MAIRMKDFIKSLSKHEQAEIALRTQELLVEESTLQELRKTLKRSQAKVDKKMRINQAAVSKLERRTDMYISTLRDFIEAMGGRLKIIAEFPGSPPVHITQF